MPHLIVRSLRTVGPWIFRIGVCIVLLVVAGGIYQGLVASKPVPGRVDADDRIPRIQVMTLREVPVRRAWTGYGTARAMTAVDVPARVSSTVIGIPTGIEDGVWVSSGQLLVRLDESDFQRRAEAATQAAAQIAAQIEQLEVDRRRLSETLELVGERVTLAEAELERVRTAAAEGAAREREIDAAFGSLIAVQSERTDLLRRVDSIDPQITGLEAREAALEAEARLARQDLERCRIVVPLGVAAGGPDAPVANRRYVLQRVDVEVGSSVQPGMRVARVVDLGRIEIPIRLPSSARASVGVGDAIELWASGDDTEGPARWTSTVARIAPEDEPGTRTMTVFAEVAQSPEDAGGLAPGRFVEARVTSSIERRRIAVPRRSLDGDRLLTVTDDFRIRSITVRPDFDLAGAVPETGLPDQAWRILSDPPPAGTPIVITPTRRLSDGTRIEPYEGTLDADAVAGRPGGGAS